MEDPAAGMSPFLSEIVGGSSPRRSREFDAPVDQLRDARGGLADDEADDLLAAEARPGTQGVVDVKIEAVVRVGDGRDPPPGRSSSSTP